MANNPFITATITENAGSYSGTLHSKMEGFSFNESEYTFMDEDNRYLKVTYYGQTESTDSSDDFTLPTELDLGNEDGVWIEVELVIDSTGSQHGLTCLFLGDPIKASKPRPKSSSSSRLNSSSSKLNPSAK
jgi:hypothetical protein